MPRNISGAGAGGGSAPFLPVNRQAINIFSYFKFIFSIVLDFHQDAINSTDIGQINRGIQSSVSNGPGVEKNNATLGTVNLCDPIKVYVLPKPVKRGI